MHHIVLIGDFVQSKQLDNRRGVQRRFAASCAALNKEREGLGLVSPLTITLGDEFQAVFSQSARLWECIFRLEAAMAPVNIRFAIGLGRITTDIQRDTALGMDGPAFHAARTAMEQLKKGDARYRVAGLRHSEHFINDALVLIAHSRRKWRTPRVITMASLLQHKAVKEICRITHSTEQAVYRNIRDGALETIASMLEAIAQRMDDTASTQPPPAMPADTRNRDHKAGDKNQDNKKQETLKQQEHRDA